MSKVDLSAHNAADFETYTDADFTSVWLWGVHNCADDAKPVWGQWIMDFMVHLYRNPGIYWFHNLGFDGQFLLHHLLSAGWVWVERPRQPKEFTTLINSDGKFYQLEIVLKNFKHVTFKDSYKKFPMSIKDMAKQFKMDLTKGEMEYRSRADTGPVTEAEIDYLYRDVGILRHALRDMLREGGVALTIGSDSLKSFKRGMGDTYAALFPQLDDETDEVIRDAYRGGYTYVPEEKRQIIWHDGHVFDINSLYPYIMVNRPMPFGEPISYDGRQAIPPGYVAIFSVTFTAQLRDGFLPIIQVNGHSIFGANEYVTWINDPVTMSFTDSEWELVNDHYTTQIFSWNGGMIFQASTNIFEEYVNYWMGIKENSEGGRRTLAKLHMNALYGKFGTRTTVVSRIPFLEDDNVVNFRLSEPEKRAPIYTAVAVFTTAFAREHTIRAAQAHYDQFLYCDTDSLHLVGDVPTDLDIHPSRLGAWKHEYSFYDAIYLRQKAYMDIAKEGPSTRDREKIVRISGLPRHISELCEMEHFLTGHIFDGYDGNPWQDWDNPIMPSIGFDEKVCKLRPKRIPGGIALVPTPFNLIP